jgi:dienelactone hydrolase
VFVLAVFGVLGVALYVVGEWYRDRDYIGRFLRHKAELASVSETVLESTSDHSVVHVLLTDARGLEVEGHLRLPAAREGRRPVLLVLGGVRTGRRTVDYLGDTGDWSVLALDYPYRGPKSGLSRWQFTAALPEMRRAVLDTVPAGMMAVDYLIQRPDVDSDRLVLAGGSFGALFAPALGAADDRIDAVAIFFGAGDLEGLIDANLDLGWPLDPVAAWLGAVIVSPLEPLKYVGRIAPRPVFMLNGTEDPAMPVACSRALHAAARKPKTVRWLPVGHVDVRSRAFHGQVLAEFVDWLQEIGFVDPAESSGFSIAP